MNQWATKVVCVILVSFVFFVVLHVLRKSQPGDFERLLRGEEGVELTSITIEGQNQKIILNDIPTMKYLTSSFSKAKKNSFGRQLGHTYYTRIGVGDEVVFVSCNTTDDIDGLSIGYPISFFEDPIYYWVPLRQPPKTVSATLNRMRLPPR